MVKVISIGPDEGSIFDDEVTKGDALVKFYDPNCPHCISMAKSWDDLGKLLEKDYEGEASLIEVHSSAVPEIKCNAAQNVKGYPTIMQVVKGGKMGTEYTGNRSTDDMLKFMKAKFKITNIKPMRGGSKKNKSKKNRNNKTKRKNKHKKTKKNNKRRNRSRKLKKH